MSEWPKNPTERTPQDTSPNIEELKSLILTSEQYAEQPFAESNDGSRTYTFELASGDKHLSYFGSDHTHDPENPLFDEIQQSFMAANPDMVYVEGMEGFNRDKDQVRVRFAQITPEEAKSHGENFYTLKLAIDAGVDFESPEPTRADEIKFLETTGFSKKDIFNFYFYRNVHGYQRQAKELTKEDCLKYIEGQTRRMREVSGWTPEELDEYEKEAIEGLDIENTSLYSSLVDPIPWEGKPQGVTNEISRSSSHLRDQFIFERIAKGLEDHNRLFVVYGSAHAVKQEPALRELFKQD